MAVTYEAIATNTLGSNQTSVTFNSLGAYTDIIIVTKATYATTLDASMLLTFNGDTGSNYSATNLAGNGSAASSGRRTSATSIEFDRASNTVPSAGITHIMNYGNSTTYKTILSRFNTSNSVLGVWLGLWRNTAAITSLTITGSSGVSFATGSTFTLYGIKAE
jgi:hypothetical protein